MNITIYGIRNCDTVKKARKWLEHNNIEYQFHDLRVEGINETLVKNWLKQVDWEILLNTRGTTWRKLELEQKKNMNRTRAVALMLQRPEIIKRPVLSCKRKVYVGFREDIYSSIFS